MRAPEPTLSRRERVGRLRFTSCVLASRPPTHRQSKGGRLRLRVASLPRVRPPIFRAEGGAGSGRVAFLPRVRPPFPSSAQGSRKIRRVCGHRTPCDEARRTPSPDGRGSLRSAHHLERVTGGHSAERRGEGSMPSELQQPTVVVAVSFRNPGSSALTAAAFPLLLACFVRKPRACRRNSYPIPSSTNWSEN